MSRFAVILGALVLSGCASNLTADEREYQRVEWLETQFKPMVAACDRSSEHVLVYDGPQNRTLRKKIEDRNFDSLSRLEAVDIHCINRRDLGRVFGMNY